MANCHLQEHGSHQHAIRYFDITGTYPFLEVKNDPAYTKRA